MTSLFSYPVYSFFLPIYSFWCMDDFSWGNTRLVVGKGNSKKVIMTDEAKFVESVITLKKFSGKVATKFLRPCSLFCRLRD